MLSKTAYVILGMVRMGKRTGYEIKSLVDVSTRHFWAASYGQIYPELKRLEEAGLVSGSAEPSGGRRRRAFELTAAGEQALDEWLSSGGSLVSELRHEGLLRFFFSDGLAAAGRVALLHTIRDEHERVRQEMLAIRPGVKASSGEQGLRAPYETLEFGIAYQEFIIGWCERLEAQLASETTKGA